VNREYVSVYGGNNSKLGLAALQFDIRSMYNSEPRNFCIVCVHEIKISLNLTIVQKNCLGLVAFSCAV